MKEGTGVPHIVFSDLDGSFLTTDKAVHPLNETALTRLAELHIPFVACSGRPRGGLTELAQRLGCSYLVASNGADISCCDTGETLASWSVDPDDAVALMERVRHMDVVVDLVVEGTLFSHGVSMERQKAMGAVPESLATHKTLVHRTEEPLEELARRGAIDRMGIWYGPRGDFEVICSMVDSMGGLQWVDSEAHIVEIVAAGVSKGAALRWLCGHLAIDPKSSVAFGNGGNDIEMLECAGDGVALCNSQPGVAVHGDHVTLYDNDNGGCGAYLLDLLNPSEKGPI